MVDCGLDDLTFNAVECKLYVAYMYLLVLEGPGNRFQNCCEFCGKKCVCSGCSGD